MSDAILRLLNSPIGDDAALAQLWDEYEFNLDEPDDNVVSDAESDTDSDVIDSEPEEMATDTDGVPVIDRGDDDTEFDMRRNDMDEAIERAVALPEFVLSKEDDIAKAAAFRFVYILHFSVCQCQSGSLSLRLSVTSLRLTFLHETSAELFSTLFFSVTSQS